MHAPSIWGILIVAVVVLLLFGRGKISGMMGEMASGIKAFQRGMREEDKPAERIETNAPTVTPTPPNATVADSTQADRRDA